MQRALNSDVKGVSGAVIARLRLVRNADILQDAVFLEQQALALDHVRTVSDKICGVRSW
jgi:hypothetical protein